MSHHAKKRYSIKYAFILSDYERIPCIVLCYYIYLKITIPAWLPAYWGLC